MGCQPLQKQGAGGGQRRSVVAAQASAVRCSWPQDRHALSGHQGAKRCIGAGRPQVSVSALRGFCPLKSTADQWCPACACVGMKAWWQQNQLQT